jgi:polyisoprenyl-teichoic acid--peptidoglycan teichoic acid transferase
VSPAQTAKNSKAQKNPLLYLLFIVIALFVFLLCYSIRFSQSANGAKTLTQSISVYALRKPMIVLVAGTDQEYERAKNGYMVKVKNSFKGRTDTIILCKFDPIGKTLSALNIPRDTRIFINGQRPDKINAINTMGGPALLKKVLEGLLGIDIDHYVLVNTQVIEQLIDQSGGIEVDIPKRMVYRDQTDGLNINFKPGHKLLNGKEAVGFLRFRHDNLGDIGRIQRQQAFLRAIKKKLADPAILTRLPQLASTTLQSIQTDLSVSDMLKLANFVRATPTESQIFATLPGDFSMPEQQTKIIYQEVPVSTTQAGPSSDDPTANPDTEGEDPAPPETVTVQRVITVNAPFISYWIPDEAEIKQVVDRLFNSSDSTPDPESRREIKIALENTLSDRVAINKVSKLLRKAGYQIVDIASSFQESQPSAIYAQKANIQEAKLLRHDLGLNENIKVLAGSIGSPLADIAVVVGPELANQLETNESASSTNKKQP